MAEALSAYQADPFSYAEARALAEALELSEPVAITLVRRGYRTPEQARAFLEADETHSPQEFRSMGAVVERVLAAVSERRRISVHGDFDVDGVCATAILVGALRQLGGECDWLIPDRSADGYGLSGATVRRLAARGTSLLITVDCGITSLAEVALAGDLGVETIVTDHHQPGTELPDCPILHPAIDGYPFSELCGAAVAWKLAAGLREAAASRSPAGSQLADAEPRADAAPGLDLAALATVADVVPLVGENRTIVRRGLEQLRRARRPGIRALLEEAGCEPTQLDEGDLAFRLAPRVNAAGRLYRADAGVELFLTGDESRAREIALELGRANGERRQVEREVEAAAEAARRELPEQLREAPGLVVAGRGWHRGVVGLVASRLAERHHRPAVVVSLDGEGMGRGSGRSIPGFDLLSALEACSGQLLGFGGHRAAAGVELRAENLDAFREAFAAHAAAVLGPEDLVRRERVDAMVGGAHLGLELAEELSRLAPFGMGNPGVRLLVPSARLRDVRSIGEGKHARFNLHSGAHRALGVAFGRSRLPVAEDEPVDAMIRLEVNRWNGSVEPRVVLRELYRQEPSPEALGPEGAEPWWERFEQELTCDPAAWPPKPPREQPQGERTRTRGSGSAAAAVAELASSGGTVLALVCEAQGRSRLAGTATRLAEYGELESRPGLAQGFDHVVLVDPPAFPHLERLAALPAGAGDGYLHGVWGESEWRLALASLARRLARRPELVAAYRDLREAGEASGELLLGALRGGSPRPRDPQGAARCFRVLEELGLLQGRPEAGRGSVRVVSSEETDLERSAAFRAYAARYEEGRRFLERRRHP